jgi:hypothetical protein
MFSFFQTARDHEKRPEAAFHNFLMAVPEQKTRPRLRVYVSRA